MLPPKSRGTITYLAPPGQYDVTVGLFQFVFNVYIYQSVCVSICLIDVHLYHLDQSYQVLHYSFYVGMQKLCEIQEIHSILVAEYTA